MIVFSRDHLEVQAVLPVAQADGVGKPRFPRGGCDRLVDGLPEGTCFTNNGLGVFLMGARRDDHTVHALTYRESVAIAKTLGWTKTPSWTEKNAYSTRNPSKRLVELLWLYEVKPESWLRFFRSTK